MAILELSGNLCNISVLCKAAKILAVLGEGLVENSVATQADVWCTIQKAYGWMLCIDELMHEQNIEGNLICITLLDHA